MDNLLKNNSNEMKTVVETFVIEETAELIYDNEQLDKWNELVKELGLTGQTQIVTKEKSPVPFMHLKQNLVEVFEVLCPRKVEVNAYNTTPIPVEILSLISLSAKENYFDKLQIWYDDKYPDPVCIGLRYATEEDRVKKYSWRMEHYLLGKWADVKHSFGELIEMATKRWKEQQFNVLTQEIKDRQRGLEDINQEAFRKFGTTVNSNDYGVGELPF